MLCLAFQIIFIFLAIYETKSSQRKWDPKGYIIYCPCMGRFGNQADHFLGALAFAKSLDRTLVLPPWRTYKNVPFSDWFQLEPLREYHRVIVAEEFMRELAPTHWPPDRRAGWCWKSASDEDRTCAMKAGSPFGPFWDGLNVTFVDNVPFQISYNRPDIWLERYPPSEYPVMAFKGAPASFPVRQDHVELHQYLHWSDSILDEALDYINKNFPGEIFVGLHLRNGIDWENACKSAKGMKKFMASPQCLGYDFKHEVTEEICFPSEAEVLRLTRKVVELSKAKAVFVATDKNPLISQLEKHLEDLKVRVFHLDPWLPQIDLAILGMADHFIGNCVSSFTAFTARERKVTGKPTHFWGYTKL